MAAKKVEWKAVGMVNYSVDCWDDETVDQMVEMRAE